MTRPSEILGSVVAASEREQLETFLDYLRDAVVRKVSGLSEEDARRSPVPSGTSLGGLIKHLRWVELGAFAEQIGQIPAAELPTPPWTDADPEADLRLEPGGKLTLRWVYLHVVLETSRHAGHADIVREMIDRSVGD